MLVSREFSLEDSSAVCRRTSSAALRRGRPFCATRALDSVPVLAFTKSRVSLPRTSRSVTRCPAGWLLPSRGVTSRPAVPFACVVRASRTKPSRFSVSQTAGPRFRLTLLLETRQPNPSGIHRLICALLLYSEPQDCRLDPPAAIQRIVIAALALTNRTLMCFSAGSAARRTGRRAPPSPHLRRSVRNNSFL